MEAKVNFCVNFIKFIVIGFLKQIQYLLYVCFLEKWLHQPNRQVSSPPRLLIQKVKNSAIHHPTGQCVEHILLLCVIRVKAGIIEALQ